MRPKIIARCITSALLCLLAGKPLLADSTQYSIQNIFKPRSAPANSILDIAWIVIAICTLIFVVVSGLLIYAIIRFRARKDDDSSEPAQIYGSNQIEMAWTVIPLLIVLVLILVTARTTIEIDHPALPDNTLRIKVVGHQWWWEVIYPEQGFITANEVHIPLSTEDAPRHTRIELESADVIHSFWVPQLGGKRDLLPNQPNQIWYEPLEAGVYLGNCAEFCGTQHANMLIRVIVDTPEEFDAWLKKQKSPPRQDKSVASGRHLFTSLACINCHAVGDIGARNGFGPDLTHFMSRSTLGAGVAKNNKANIYQWLEDPNSLKPGCYMPNMKLSEKQLNQLTDYLLTLN